MTKVSSKRLPEADGSSAASELDPASRDLEICALRQQGLTLHQIADKVNLTRERVRQIIKRLGGPTRSDVRDLRLRERADREEHDRSLVLTDFTNHPGATASEIARRLGMSESRVRAVLPKEMRTALVPETRSHGPATQRWTDEAIFTALRQAATYEFPLTTSAYAKLLRLGEVTGPSIPLIFKRLNGWCNACELAGVECGPVRRGNYESHWTDEDLVAFVMEYLQHPAADGTYSGYADWRKTHREEAPSAPTMRNRLGRWAEIKREALRRLTQPPQATLQIPPEPFVNPCEVKRGGTGDVTA